jgi:hypothetical protein
MQRLESREIVFSEKGLLEKLGLLNDPNVVGIKAVWLNNRYLQVPEDIESIKITVTRLVPDADFKIRTR